MPTSTRRRQKSRQPNRLVYGLVGFFTLVVLGAVLLWWLLIWRTTTHSVTRSFNRHFYGFLSQWQAVDKNAATCVRCHAGHALDGDSTLSFLNEQRATDVCQACHRVAGS